MNLPSLKSIEEEKVLRNAIRDLNIDFYATISEFVFVNQRLDWYKARDECFKMGGDLASFASLKENENAMSIVPDDTDREAWIGGSDAWTETSWYWVDGTKMNFRNFEDKTNYDHEDCLFIFLKHSNSRDIGKWDDSHCSNGKPFFCKRTPINPWLGLSEKNGREGRWKWSDGTDLSYSNWLEYQPNDFFEGQDCA